MRTFVIGMSLAFGSASAAEVDVGIGLGVGVDVVDPASGSHTRFGPSPTLVVPVRVALSDRVFARGSAVAEVASGTDRYTWTVGVAGEDVRIATDGHFAFAAVGGATVGPDIVLLQPRTGGGPTLYAGVGLGGAWVGTFHSFSQETVQLMDQDANDLDNPNNIDPYSSQAVWLTDVRAGLGWGDALRTYVELSIGGAWVGEAKLRKTYAEYDVRRSPYGWTPIRLVGGIWF